MRTAAEILLDSANSLIYISFFNYFHIYFGIIAHLMVFTAFVVRCLRFEFFTINRSFFNFNFSLHFLCWHSLNNAPDGLHSLFNGARVLSCGFYKPTINLVKIACLFSTCAVTCLITTTNAHTFSPIFHFSAFPVRAETNWNWW